MKKLIIILVTSILAFSLSTNTFAKSTQASKQTSQQQLQVSTVNLNKADAKEIAKILKGIGLKKAQAIVSYRKQNGSFKAVEEIASVKGIGVKTIANNYKRIVLK